MPTPSYDAEDIAITALRTTVLGIAAILAVVPAAKIQLWDIGTEDIIMPYAILEYVDGGWERDEMVSNTGNVLVLFSIRTTNKSVAHDFRHACAELHDKTLDVSDFTNVSAYASIDQVGSYRNVDRAQGLPIYEVGAYYEIRFNVN